jgi:hypothetical protein
MGIGTIIAGEITVMSCTGTMVGVLTPPTPIRWSQPSTSGGPQRTTALHQTSVRGRVHQWSGVPALT